MTAAIIWSDHALERTFERAEGARAIFRDAVELAIRSKSWTVFWEHDKREERGLRQNLVIVADGGVAVARRNEKNGNFIVVSVLTPEQAAHNVQHMWGHTCNDARAKAGQYGRPAPATALTHSPFAALGKRRTG